MFYLKNAEKLKTAATIIIAEAISIGIGEGLPTNFCHVLVSSFTVILFLGLKIIPIKNFKNSSINDRLFAFRSNSDSKQGKN